MPAVAHCQTYQVAHAGKEAADSEGARGRWPTPSGRLEVAERAWLSVRRRAGTSRQGRRRTSALTSPVLTFIAAMTRSPTSQNAAPPDPTGADDTPALVNGAPVGPSG